MTVGELKDLLEDYRDGDEVRFMSQAGWPFEYSVRGVTDHTELGREGEGDDEEEEVGFQPAASNRYDAAPKKVLEQDERVVYLVEGSQLGYGSKAAWEVC